MTVHASTSGTFPLGGDLPVHRLGFGAMRTVGKGIFGPPRDKRESLAVLRRAVELGITLIDTAESYGPHFSEELIAEALHPYPEGLVIGTKGGLERPGPDQWKSNGRPERLRRGLEGSLRRLRLDRIDLYQLHRIDAAVPEGEQFDALVEFQREGKIRHLGLSEVSLEQIGRARKRFPVASVQNRYNVADREWDPVVDYCERQLIGFIPWDPLQTGTLAEPGGPLATIAAQHRATPAQVALAWLLARTPVMLPIPGTSRVKHLEENAAAAGLELAEDALHTLNRLTAPVSSPSASRRSSSDRSR